MGQLLITLYPLYNRPPGGFEGKRSDVQKAVRDALDGDYETNAQEGLVARTLTREVMITGSGVILYSLAVVMNGVSAVVFHWA